MDLTTSDGPSSSKIESRPAWAIGKAIDGLGKARMYEGENLAKMALEEAAAEAERAPRGRQAALGSV